MQIRGKVALVTGGGIRVGRTIALALAREGASIAAHYHSSAEGARQVASEVSALGGKADVFSCDLTDPGAASKLAHDVMQRFGRIDILINSAASMERTPFESIDVESWDRIMSLNFRAPFFLAHEVAKGMKKAGGGVIVNIADTAAFEAWPDYVVHCLSKSGVVSMTRVLAKMLAPEIRVNAVAPGAVLLPENWPEESKRQIENSTPLGKLGSPEDVASAVVYLITSGYVTGETLVVDGGRLIRR